MDAYVLSGKAMCICMRSQRTLTFFFPCADGLSSSADSSDSKEGIKSNSVMEMSEREEIPVNYEAVSRAYYRIRSGIHKTPCVRSKFLSELCECEVYMKKDMEQESGSFKERGARNSLMLLSPEEKALGVIAASAGNHALALAWHGRDLGVPVTVVMPTVAPMTKVENCRKFGANVIIHGDHIGEAKEYAITQFSDMRYINGYDDPEIVAGAGTMGIEILEQVPDVDVIVVPIGGAGLIAGVSLAVKTLKPTVEVVGVEPENVASYKAAMRAGEPVYEYVAGTLADGLAVPVVGPTAFKVAKAYVDYTTEVSESQISVAVLRCLEMEKVIVEGGGAAALAAVLPGGPLFGRFRGKKIVFPACGGNIDTTVLGRIIDRGLAADERLIRFTATVSDRPGGVADLSRDMAEMGLSIKDIYHERAWLKSRIDQVQVKIVTETTGAKHAKEALDYLRSRGYEIERW